METEQQRARYLARLANHTYHLNSVAHDMEGLQAQLQQMHLALDANPGNPFYDLPSGHHGYIAEGADHVVVAIRGSGEADDWRNNLRYQQIAYRMGGHVHTGFAVAAQGITQAIQTEIQRAPSLYSAKPIWLTGHSSGGSVAILVAQELSMQQVEVAGIYTFGAPKVGDADFAQKYPLRNKVHAFATLGDLVPLLPPPWLARTDGHWRLQRYQHVVKPQLLVGKTFSLRAAFVHLRNIHAGPLEKIIGALIDFSPHSLIAAYIPNLK
ncbi:MAG: lipase family protein [Caldilineaceae bacterium]|nr:lipase family protein [Caldilineaceae bacterium]MCB0126522.1 lipase family protein [Caldilineaceae bacterium]